MTDWQQERKALEAGASNMNIALTSQQTEQLIQYLMLFEKWNRSYNLSAIRDPMSMVSVHLLDSLSIYPYLDGQRFIDVGTGGGLPGIPMAIMYPQRHFTLLDSAGKKTRFLFQIKQALQLDNVEVVNCRVEAFKPELLFDGVISRAFASLEDMTNYCKHLLDKGGRFWAMKGVFPEEELKDIASEYTLSAHHTLHVSGLEAERCLLELKAL